MMSCRALLCAGLLLGCGGGKETGSTSHGSGGAGGHASSSTSSSSSTSTGGGASPGGACDDAVSPDADIHQELPKRFVDTSLAAPTGKTIAVAAGGDLQKAIDSAQAGDVITLAAG